MKRSNHDREHAGSTTAAHAKILAFSAHSEFSVATAVRENVVAIFDKFRDLEITGQREMFAGPAVQRIGLYSMRDTWAFSRNIVHFRGTQ